MANAPSFPQLPSTVWSGVWQILRKTPNRRLDENMLAVELNVQPTAAKQYLNELIRLGLLGTDSAPTSLASRWRQDGDDPIVINEILDGAYPTDLRELAPIDDLNRDKIVRWFMGQGLGEGAAKNKAATYLRIANGVTPTDTAPSAESATTAPRSRAPAPTRAKRDKASPSKNAGSDGGQTSNNGTSSGRRPDLNVNVQIHISADSSSEQIDAIFSAMKRYFDEPQSL